MGTRIVDTETGAVVAESHGLAWTDSVDMAISNGRKREQAETLIARAKRNARVIADVERQQNGRRNEQTRTLQALADSLPFGTRVEFDDAGVPVRLVNVEESEQETSPEPTDSNDAPAEPRPNKFDAIALEVANA